LPEFFLTNYFLRPVQEQTNFFSEPLIRNKFLTAGTPTSLIGNPFDISQAQLSLNELLTDSLTILAQQHKDFSLSSSFMEYLSHLQAVPGMPEEGEGRGKRFALVSSE
jgi:hypothetical protein